MQLAGRTATAVACLAILQVQALFIRTHQASQLDAKPTCQLGVGETKSTSKYPTTPRPTVLLL